MTNPQPPSHPTRALYDQLHAAAGIDLTDTDPGVCWACEAAASPAILELAAKAAEHDRLAAVIDPAVVLEQYEQADPDLEERLARYRKHALKSPPFVDEWVEHNADAGMLPTAEQEQAIWERALAGRPDSVRASLAIMRARARRLGLEEGDDQADAETVPAFAAGLLAAARAWADQVEAEPDDPNPLRVSLHTAAQEQPHPLAGRWSRGAREADVGDVAGTSGDVEPGGLREPDVGEVEPRGRDVGEVELGHLADGLCSTWTDTWRRHRYEPAGCSHHQAQVRELIARGRVETRSGFLRRLAADYTAVNALASGMAGRDVTDPSVWTQDNEAWKDNARDGLTALARHLEENP